MRCEQISVFLENKMGRLSDLTGAFHEAGVNIRALSLADTSDFGVARLIVDDTGKAKEALKRKGMTFKSTDVVALRVADRPGGLHEIVVWLKEADINVEYMYAHVNQDGKDALLIFRFDRTEEAVRLLRKRGMTFLSQSGDPVGS